MHLVTVELYCLLSVNDGALIELNPNRTYDLNNKVSCSQPNLTCG